MGSYSSCFCVFYMFPSFFENLLAFWHNKMGQVCLLHTLLQLYNHPSVPLHQNWYLETNIWGIWCTHCYWDVAFPRLFHWIQLRNICIQLYCTHYNAYYLFIYLSIFLINTYQYIKNHEFPPISLIAIQQHRSDSSFIPFLICNSFLLEKEYLLWWSLIYLHIWSILL